MENKNLLQANPKEDDHRRCHHHCQHHHHHHHPSWVRPC